MLTGQRPGGRSRSSPGEMREPTRTLAAVTSSITNAAVLLPGGAEAVAPDGYATAPGPVAGPGTHEETG